MLNGIEKLMTRGTIILALIAAVFLGKLLVALHKTWGVGEIPARTAVDATGNYVQYPAVAGEFAGSFGLGTWPYIFMFLVVGIPVAVMLLRRAASWNLIPGALLVLMTPDYTDTSRFELGEMAEYVTFTDASREFTKTWYSLTQIIWFVVSLTALRALLSFTRTEVTTSGSFRNKLATLIADEHDGETTAPASTLTATHAN